MSPSDDQWLKRALDAAELSAVAAPTPNITSEQLLAAARRRRARTIRRRSAATVAGIGLVIAGAVQLTNRGPDSGADWSLKRPVRSVGEVETRRALAELERVADMHLAVVQGLSQSPRAGADDNVDDMAIEAELWQAEAIRSAGISWQYATLVEDEFRDIAAAQREYRRLIERFPGTTWADLAAQSLRRLSSADRSQL